MQPTVYLLHGNDQVAIRAAVNEMQAKLGDAAIAEMNTVRFEDAGVSVDAIRNATQATPFLSDQRLVIVSGTAKSFSSADAKAHFTQLLQDVPETTKLVLIEAPLESKHWLLKWAQAAGQQAAVQKFALPEGPAMAAWLQQRAKELGGELQPQAAAALVQLIGSEKLAAEQELQKLLAYAAYSRPITAADVAVLCQPIGEQGDFFALIDALGAGNGSRSMQLLETLLRERDLILLFFSLVGHFRLLLQSREFLDAGKNDGDIAQQLGIHPYRAQKLAGQARRFSPGALEAIYRRLLELDEQIKTGEIEVELAMEMFAAGLSQPAH